MDPFTSAALLMLLDKGLTAAGSLIGNLSKNRGEAVAIGRDGEQVRVESRDRDTLDLRDPYDQLASSCVVSAEFVAHDELAALMLDPDQPVMVVLSESSAHTDLDSIVALTTLGSGFVAHLSPGTYQVGAYLPDSLRLKAVEDVIGGAYVELSVQPDDGFLEAAISIEAFPPELRAPNSPVAVSRMGFVTYKESTTIELPVHRGYAYTVQVNPVDVSADLDLVVVDDRGFEVCSDTAVTSEAMCQFTPHRSTDYRFEVRSARGDTAFLLHLRA